MKVNTKRATPSIQKMLPTHQKESAEINIEQYAKDQDSKYKPVPGFEQYEVSTFGTVRKNINMPKTTRNYPPGYILTPLLESSHLVVSIQYKAAEVSRYTTKAGLASVRLKVAELMLVAHGFERPEPAHKYVVCYKDRNPLHCTIQNAFWCPIEHAKQYSAKYKRRGRRTMEGNLADRIMILRVFFSVMKRGYERLPVSQRSGRLNISSLELTKNMITKRLPDNVNQTRVGRIVDDLLDISILEISKEERKNKQGIGRAEKWYRIKDDYFEEIDVWQELAPNWSDLVDFGFDGYIDTLEDPTIQGKPAAREILKEALVTTLPEVENPDVPAPPSSEIPVRPSRQRRAINLDSVELRLPEIGNMNISLDEAEEAED